MNNADASMEAKKSLVYVVFPDGRNRVLLQRPRLETNQNKSMQCEKGTQTTDLDTMSMATCDDGKTEQECLKCHIVKSVSYYHKNQRTCKGCIGLYHEWRKINKENIDRVKKELKQSRDEFFAKHLGLGQEPAVKDEISK